MIVLDEQLKGRDIETAIARWYPGSIRFITELRPGSIIKDDAVPALLRHVLESTFVTINESDFWRIVPVTNAFCVVCAALPDFRATEVAPLLQRLLRHPDFSTKAKRKGKVVRVASNGASFYSVTDATIRAVENF